MVSRLFSLGRSLSFKLLVCTIGFVLVIEVLVYVPSLAQFRLSYLEERVAAAQIAALSLIETPNNMFSDELEASLLQTAGVRGVVLSLDDRRLLLSQDMPRALTAQYDLRQPGVFGPMIDALATLGRAGKGAIQVTSQPIGIDGQQIAIIMDEGDLFAALGRYSRNVLYLSLLISLFTGVLVFWTLHGQLVRPMARITSTITRFGANPDDPLTKLPPSERIDEIGHAERELARMQEELRMALQQRRRLASLGEAVAKINHDLRNILATAQLASENLAMVEDTRLKRQSQRIVRALDRGIALCESTLRYGRAEEAEPQKAVFPLRPLVEEAFQVIRSAVSSITFENNIPADMKINADREQFFRIFVNLGRNALQVLQGGGQEGVILVDARPAGQNAVEIDICDNGPGIPPDMQEALFTPFGGTTKVGGSGLGLAIVAELVHGHGGQITLHATGPQGTCFRIHVPQNDLVVGATQSV